MEMSRFPFMTSSVGSRACSSDLLPLDGTSLRHLSDTSAGNSAFSRVVIASHTPFRACCSPGMGSRVTSIYIFRINDDVFHW